MHGAHSALALADHDWYNPHIMGYFNETRPDRYSNPPGQAKEEPVTGLHYQMSPWYLRVLMYLNSLFHGSPSWCHEPVPTPINGVKRRLDENGDNLICFRLTVSRDRGIHLKDLDGSDGGAELLSVCRGRGEGGPKIPEGFTTASLATTNTFSVVMKNINPCCLQTSRKWTL